MSIVVCFKPSASLETKSGTDLRVETTSSFRATAPFTSLQALFTQSAARSAHSITRPLQALGPFVVARGIKKKGKMPPKKAVQEEKVLLGRPGNNLKSGIVGRLCGLEQRGCLAC